MNRHVAYKIRNEEFLVAIAKKQGVHKLYEGVLYEVLQQGEGKQPTIRSIVSVYYKGWLINEKVFDDNTRQGYPDALRLNELIRGWQIALTHMRAGDKWRIYIPASAGYGTITMADIPKYSTLIFEIELVSVM